MPPKRRPRAEMLPDPTGEDGNSASQEVLPEAKKAKLVEEEPTPIATPTVVAKKASADTAIIDDGEAVEAPKAKPTPTGPILPKSAEELNPDLIEDDREVCFYDLECIRKNPVHFKEYRHPKLMESRLEAKKAANGGHGASHHTTSSAVPAMRRAGSSGLALNALEVAKTTVRFEEIFQL